MTIDPSIALAYRPPQVNVEVPNPIQQFGQVLTLRNLMTQGQSGQLELQTKMLELERLRLEAQQRQAIANLLGGGAGAAPDATGTPQATAGPLQTAPPGAYQEPNLMRPAGPEGRAPVTPPPVQPTPVGGTVAPTAPPETGASLSALMSPQPAAPAVTPGSAAAVAPSIGAAPAADPFAGLPSTADLIRVGGATGLAYAENIAKAKKTYYDNLEAQHNANKAQVTDLATIASRVHDEPTKLAAIADAFNRKLITPEVRDQLQSHPYDKQEWDGFQTQALDSLQRIEQARAAVNQKALEEKQAHERAMYPSEEAKATGDAAEAGSKALLSQHVTDAQALYPLLAKNDGGAAAQAFLAKLSPERAAPFVDVKTGQEALNRALNPEQRVNAIHQNFQTLAEAEKIRLDREKFNAEFGPGSAESWAAQVYANPDTVKDVPANMRTAALNAFTAKHPGLPFPSPLEGAAKDQETAAQNTKGDITWIRNAMKNPNIANNIGGILGRLQNVEQATGETTGLPGADAQMAQEFRTRMRNMLANEAASMRARVNPKVLDDLAKSSGSIKMDPKMLAGALDGVEGSVNQRLDGFERRRFGGQMRPAEARGGTPSATVKMKAPDGTVRDIPSDQVDHYKSIGATVVQ